MHIPLPRLPKSQAATAMIMALLVSIGAACSNRQKPKTTAPVDLIDPKPTMSTTDIDAQPTATRILLLPKDQVTTGPQGHSWTYLGRSVATNVYVFKLRTADGDNAQELAFYCGVDAPVHDRKILFNQSVELAGGDEGQIELRFSSLPRKLQSSEGHVVLVAGDQVELPNGDVVSYKEAQHWTEPRWVRDVLFTRLDSNRADEYFAAHPELSTGSNQLLFAISKRVPTEAIQPDVVTELSQGVALETRGGVLMRRAGEANRVWLHFPGRKPEVIELGRSDVVQVGPSEFLLAEGYGGIVIREPTQTLSAGKSYQLKRGELVAFEEELLSYLGSGHESYTTQPGGPEEVSHVATFASFSATAWPRAAKTKIKKVYRELRVYEKGSEEFVIAGKRYQLHFLSGAYDKSIEIRIDSK